MKQKRSSLLRKREGSVRAKTRYISELIKESTNAPAQDVLMIEHIMRSDVFHSTLDWQSEEQSNPHRPRAFGGKGAEWMKKEITSSTPSDNGWGKTEMKRRHHFQKGQ
jgi:hypothetical protein